MAPPAGCPTPRNPARGLAPPSKALTAAEPPLPDGAGASPHRREPAPSAGRESRRCLLEPPQTATGPVSRGASLPDRFPTGSSQGLGSAILAGPVVKDSLPTPAGSFGRRQAARCRLHPTEFQKTHSGLQRGLNSPLGGPGAPKFLPLLQLHHSPCIPRGLERPRGAGKWRPAPEQSGRSAGLNRCNAGSSPSAPARLNPRNSGGQPLHRSSVAAPAARFPHAAIPQAPGPRVPRGCFPPHHGGVTGASHQLLLGVPPPWHLQLSPRELPEPEGTFFSTNWGFQGTPQVPSQAQTTQAGGRRTPGSLSSTDTSRQRSLRIPSSTILAGWRPRGSP